MTRYSKTTILVGGVLEFKLEMYTEHNHSTLYNEIGDCVFDGYFCEAEQVKKGEIERLVALADSMGMKAEII